MTEPLTVWNRKLVEETIGVLEASRDATVDAISRLRGFLAVNPGGPLLEMGSHIEPARSQPKDAATDTQEKSVDQSGPHALSTA